MKTIEKACFGLTLWTLMVGWSIHHSAAQTPIAPHREVIDELADRFAQPPDSARPWVYWFWLNGNITRQGITADLEAMKRVGIGGVLIMEVDQGAPVGPVDFMSANWRELFQHVHREAQRLGLQVNMNNDAGWNGSGGPWITPELSMQKVVWSEIEVEGPQRFEGCTAAAGNGQGFLSRYLRDGISHTGVLPHRPDPREGHVPGRRSHDHRAATHSRQKCESIARRS